MPSSEQQAKYERWQELSYRCAQILKGNPPEIIAAALADLMSSLLAGFQGEEKEQIRQEIFASFVKTVMAMVPLTEKELLEAYARKHHGETKN